MGTSGDKIVLLDGMGSGSGSAANGLLSMIPGMFTSLLGGNKMDPNLVAALMNGRNNQDQFGGANGWWLWIIVLFWLWGGRGFGNGLSTTTPVTVSNAGVIVNKTPIVDKVGAHMTGQDITTPVASSDPIVGAYTEHLVYYNKCTGVFRMLGHTATAATAPSA